MYKNIFLDSLEWMDFLECYMKSFNGFKEYNKRSCIKTNLITSIGFILIATAFFICYVSVLLVKKDEIAKADSGLGYVFLFAFGFLIISFMLIITTMVVPMFINIYDKYLDNLKSLIGLWLCNLMFIFFMSFNFENLIKYILFGMLASLVILSCKYYYIKRRERGI